MIFVDAQKLEARERKGTYNIGKLPLNKIAHICEDTTSLHVYFLYLLSYFYRFILTLYLLHRDSNSNIFIAVPSPPYWVPVLILKYLLFNLYFFTVANAEVMQVWKNKSKNILLLTGVVYGVGSIISPIVTGPFLSNLKSNNFTNDHNNESASNLSFVTYSIYNDTNVTSYSTFPLPTDFSNDLDPMFTLSTETSSDLYIPFSISSSLSMLFAIVFLIFYMTHKSEESPEQRCTNIDKTIDEGRSKSVVPRSLPVHLKTFALFVTGSFLFVAISIAEAYGSFLNVFCVQQMQWSKTSTSLLTSVLNVLGVIANISAIFIGRCINSLIFLGLICIIIITSIVGTFLSSIYYVDIGLWVMVPLSGYANSLTFVLLFSWTNEYLFPVTSRVTSVFLVTSMVGSSLNPILLGYLMEEISYFWFCYLFFIESVILMLIFIIGALLTRYIFKMYGKTYKIELEEIIEMTTDSEINNWELDHWFFLKRYIPILLYSNNL